MKTLTLLILLTLSRFLGLNAQSSISLNVDKQISDNDTLRRFVVQPESIESLRVKLNNEFGEPQKHNTGFHEWINVDFDKIGNSLSIYYNDGYLIESEKSIRFVTYKRSKQIDDRKHRRYTYLEIVDEKGNNIIDSNEKELAVIEWFE